LQSTILAIKKINESEVLPQQGKFASGATKTKKKYAVKKTPSAALPTAFQKFSKHSQKFEGSLKKVKKPSSIVDHLSESNKKLRIGGAEEKKSEKKSQKESFEESSEESSQQYSEQSSVQSSEGSDEYGDEESDERIIIRIGRNRNVNETV